MPKELERDLGLYATITVSIGAMVGSGIFVLPGLAAKIAGPAVVLAYLLAGFVVLPAAVSKAEMATAMPESGGTYLFIDRAMGSLLGTIAGLGAWFSLVFKSAFALVGLGAYLLLLVPTVPADAVKPIALVLAGALLVVNVAGVKETGRVQTVVVTVVMVALVAFIGEGLTYIDRTHYHPFFAQGGQSLLAATAFVFVSYAGVTKIASVAEEVEDPGRNIPLGVLTSIVVMMVVYTLVVFTFVGVVPLDAVESSLTPMAAAAEAFAGPVGEFATAGVAVLALLSMANAGILSSSRFPLAMSRDSLLPPQLSAISERFRTPVPAIAFTGAVLLALIAFVPVRDLAKLASAFQILVFSIVNVALVALRESDRDWYDPSFRAPGYPWVQLAGIVGGVVLLSVIGLLPLLGAFGIIVGGAVWYRVYGRSRVEREGAALDAIRRTAGDQSVNAIRQAFATGGSGGVLVAVGPGTSDASASTLLRIAAAVVRRRGGQLVVRRFEEVPAQVTLSSAAEEHTPADESFERTVAAVTDSFDVPVDVGEVVCHDVENAVVNYAERSGVGLVLGEWRSEFFRGELLGRDVDWYMERAPCDLAFVRDRGFEDVEEIAVVADRGPYDPLEVLLADAVADACGATLHFVYAMDQSASDEQREAAEEYHRTLSSLCTVPVTWQLHRADSPKRTLIAAAAGSDLSVASTSAHHLLYDVVFGSVPDALADSLDSTVLLVHSREPRRHTFLRYVLERVAF